ncbi:coiled-coil domain-containing protein [Flavobacterium sp.]|uniref:coiled-coil domain-containing protein n=1 Tax=Flavobacterium sp. TaxID=239 RepID=UPI003752CAA2
MKTFVTFLMFVFVFPANIFAQNDKAKISKNNSVVMTWNKNTPEQEMKDDINSLKSNNDIIIKYSNLKRNSKSEIVSIKIEYTDNEGNSGSQEYNNKNAIPEIKFHKNNDEIGFGDLKPNNNFALGNLDFNDLQKQFSNRIKIDTLGNNEIFKFNLDDKNRANIRKSKIIVQKDGRKPLVIEDGKITEGTNDYSKEEIDKILNENKFNSNENLRFNLSEDNFDVNNLKEELEKMQNQIQKMTPNSLEDEIIAKPLKSRNEDLSKEIKDAKEEMIKAKKEMEEARKELQKAKSEIKTQRV